MQTLFAGLPQDGDYLGEEDAPITVTVFSDLQCVGCDDFQVEVVNPLIESRILEPDRGEQALRMEFRHFSLAPNATTNGAIAAEAAGLQDHQWQFIDVFFRNQDVFRERGQVTEELLREVAELSGEIDIARWSADYADPATEALVAEDARLAEELRLPGGGPAVVVAGPSDQVQLVTDQKEDPPTLEQVEAAIAQVG